MLLYGNYNKYISPQFYVPEGGKMAEFARTKFRSEPSKNVNFYQNDNAPYVIIVLVAR